MLQLPTSLSGLFSAEDLDEPVLVWSGSAFGSVSMSSLSESGPGLYAVETYNYGVGYLFIASISPAAGTQGAVFDQRVSSSVLYMKFLSYDGSKILARVNTGGGGSGNLQIVNIWKVL